MAKQFLDKNGVSTLWNKIKSMFVKKAKLGENANFNDVTEGGMYRYNSSITNGPDGAGSFGQLLVVRGTDDTIAQLCFPYQDSRMFLRTGNAVGNSSGTWQGWVEIATDQVNGFNPDNFQDGTKWLNHQPGQNEVGNANRPLILFGTQIKNNSGQIIATEEYVNNKVGSGGSSGGFEPKLVWSGSSGSSINVSIPANSIVLIYGSATPSGTYYGWGACYFTGKETYINAFVPAKSSDGIIWFYTTQYRITSSGLSVSHGGYTTFESSPWTSKDNRITLKEIYIIN